MAVPRKAGWRACAAAALASVILVGAARGAGLEADPAMAASLLARINQIRTQAGLSPLAADPRLAQAAQAFVEDLARRRVAANVDMSGADLDTRFRRVGYAYSLALEDVALGIETPAGVVNYWMSHPTDRLNLMAPAARDAGVGFVRRSDDRVGRDYVYYWVLDLGTKLERQIGN
jgi:uncharacterized protein YkwD